jgi:hypothetical protein
LWGITSAIGTGSREVCEEAAGGVGPKGEMCPWLVANCRRTSIDDGLKHRQRYDKDGNPISAEDAHAEPKTQECPPEGPDSLEKALAWLDGALSDWFGATPRDGFPMTP